MMLTVPKPAGFSHGDLLAEQVGAEVYATDDALHFPTLDDGDRDRVTAAVEAHTPPPPEVDPQEAFAAAIESATTIADLKAALLGKGDRSAMAAAKGKPQQ